MASVEARPAPPSAVDRIRSIYSHPGPYTSVYLQTLPLLPDSERNLHERWLRLRRELSGNGAPDRALDAITARLALPAPDDTGGICVLAAADGHTVVDHSPEPPRVDFTHLDNLPYVAPLLEWEQHRIPHLVVTVDEAGADVVVFTADHRTGIETVTPVGATGTLAADIAARVDDIDARLVVLAGPGGMCRDLAAGLKGLVDPACGVVVDDHDIPDELADATVRHLADAAARATVGHLREFRFLAGHDAAVDGMAATIKALVTDGTDLLLIHDDPSDERRVWVGDDPAGLSFTPEAGMETDARFVDAAIRSAIARNIAVHIIPSTGPGGPDGDVAALDRSPSADSVTRPDQT